MPLPHLERPLVFLDIESTGLHRTQDRIIELGLVKMHPDGLRETRVWRFNPGMPIPPASTHIHGFTDQDVQNCPSFAEKADDVAAFLHQCDLAGYNLIHFDVPMLEAEFKRANVAIDFRDCCIIDAQTIFHKREPRDLEAALAFYCRRPHPGAHGALADAEAVLHVLEGQYTMYPDLPADMKELAAYCSPRTGNIIDREGKLCWTDEGDVAINFGQNKGKRLKDLTHGKATYLHWILNKDFSEDVKTIVRNALNGLFPDPPATLEQKKKAGT